MTPITENLWSLHYPLSPLGDYLGRNVTVMRLRSGDLVIHSTGPFTPEDVAAIKAVGTPAYILEVFGRHDTFAQEGRDAFPVIPYYAPTPFSDDVEFATEPLRQPPGEWVGEIDIQPIEGHETVSEYAVLHIPSRTLIVADLVFNVESDAPLGTKFISLVAVGLHASPGVPRPEKMGIKDRAACARSLQAILAWDFDRVIVGHGERIETGGKARVAKAFEESGLLKIA